MLSILILTVCTILIIIANPLACKTARSIAALKEFGFLTAAGLLATGLVLLASGEQLVPLIWTSGLSIADFCTVARKTWAGHRALLFAKGAI